MTWHPPPLPGAPSLEGSSIPPRSHERSIQLNRCPTSEPSCGSLNLGGGGGGGGGGLAFRLARPRSIVCGCGSAAAV